MKKRFGLWVVSVLILVLAGAAIAVNSLNRKSVEKEIAGVRENSSLSEELSSLDETESNDSLLSEKSSNEASLISVTNNKSASTKTAVTAKKSQSSAAKSSSDNSDEYKFFTGQEFKEFYDNFQYEKVQKITAKPYITRNTAADKRIQSLAEARGYKLRYESTNKSFQPEANAAWKKLKSLAGKNGHNLVLVSGFRSINAQRDIFLGVLGKTYTNAQIAAGEADKRINQILTTRSIPGYSKHHTGYTIDIGCNSSDLINFKNTPCYQWISKDNYRNAKKAGFIPSYPDGAGQQGPNPEQWEYVWVGEENLKN